MLVDVDEDEDDEDDSDEVQESLVEIMKRVKGKEPVIFSPKPKKISQLQPRRPQPKQNHRRMKATTRRRGTENEIKRTRRIEVDLIKLPA